jgi:hypothetical protein
MEENIHTYSIMGVDLIMKSSLVRKTLDNITVLLITFENFDNYLNKKRREFDIIKYENLNIKTEVSQSNKKRLDSLGNDNNIISSSSKILETENHHSINVDRLLNLSSRNSMDKEDKKNFQLNKNKYKNTLSNLKIDSNKKSFIQDNNKNHGGQRIVKINFDKLKIENITNNVNYNINRKLPPVIVMNTENNFRESDDKKINLYKNIFNLDEKKRRLNKLSLNDLKNNSKKIPIPIKLISLENKRSTSINVNFDSRNKNHVNDDIEIYNNNNFDDEDEYSNIISFDKIEDRVLDNNDFKSKYFHNEKKES